MTVLSEKSHSEFIFVGDHPAIDFANTLSISQGQWIDHLRVWADVIDWLSLAGLSTDPALQTVIRDAATPARQAPRQP